MSVKVISFDVGDTLLRDRWQYDNFSCDCLEYRGIAINRPLAAQTYRRIFGERYAAYQKLNLNRDYAGGDAWWLETTRIFLLELGEDPARAQEVVAGSLELLYSGESKYFPIIPDAMATLSRLREDGYRMGIISNWDMTLHRSLQNIGFDQFFDSIISSGEHGFEKPDGRIFETFCAEMSCDADQVVHIGDNLIADIQGAAQYGMQTIFFNEHSEPSFATGWKNATVNQLSQIPGALKKCS